ncbi:hypothetical protein LTR24_008165 [Lithohypha guttulata]|uniref:RRM domain-containing protein n=1 Tax=Lithohypha guttulata TaxID=1690604 RepID=A0ABR0K2M4_9EURO|nr:hypothetical protein LTR24_008165 [Lithohypha guttulata]
MATFMSPDTGHDDFDNDTGIPKLDLASSNASTRSLATRRNLSVAPVAIPARLSPTAEDFTPGANNTTFTINAPNARVGAQDRQGNLAVRELLIDSDPESSTPSHSPVSTLGGVDLTSAAQPNPGVIGSGPAARPIASQRAPTHEFGHFTCDDDVTRAFLVANVRGPSVGSMFELVAVSYKNFSSIVNINAQELSKGLFSVEFTDHEEAKQALFLTVNFIFHNQPVQCYKLLPKDIARMHGMPLATVSDHVAEYIVSIVDVSNGASHVTIDDVLRACRACGTVKAFRAIRPLLGAAMSFRVEWSDSRTNVWQLSMALLSGYRITLLPYTPDVVRSSEPRGLAAPPSPATNNDDHVRSVMAFLHPGTPKGVNGNTNANAVDIMKIMLGQDVRTTIMLRNIPNRVDQAGLKKLLDETSFGLYDFMYLRIDFANNCNVGYAFINFVDPVSIVPFAKARAGQKWNLFQSDKVAEISYATIQGRDCLIQKFRNSSVMLERPAFRPKLYRTGNGPDAGTEEAFPKPDNHAKLKRSCDNAEHVGLYLPESPATSPGSFIPNHGPSMIPAPRNQRAGGFYTKPVHSRGAIAFNRALALIEHQVQHEDNPYLPPSPQSPSPTCLYAPREGQAYRERQRRQFSQFDRGTPGAESELASFPGQMAQDVTPTRNVSGSGYRGPLPASAFRAPDIAITPTDYIGPPQFGSRPVRPPVSTMGYDPSIYLSRSFQGLRA